MQKTLRNVVIAGWMGMMFCGMGQAGRAAAEESGSQIAICMYNYAQVPPDTMRQAGQVAAGILRQAGVKSNWEVVPFASDAPASDAGAGPSCELSVSRITVTILTHEMAGRLGLPTEVLGLAPGDPADPRYRDRIVAYVFDHVAESMVQQQTIASKGQLLGHAIAHEIGHILLSMPGHSRTGIMQADWGLKDFESMAQGTLVFSSRESSRIQAEVIRRTRINGKVEASLSR